MPIRIWIKRAATVFLLTCYALFCAELLKGHGWRAGARFAVEWSLISTGVFAAFLRTRPRDATGCALCGDAPEEGR